MIKFKKRLPNKLSALTKAALLDLIATEADPRYEINMASWHERGSSGTCHVCFAGSVMAQRCEIRRNRTVAMSDFDRKTQSKFYALNKVRCGEVSEAYSELTGDMIAPPSLIALNRHIVPHATNREAFITDMSRLIIDLEVAGY